MQHVGQTKRSLKTRFGEHFRKMKHPKKIDTFLYNISGELVMLDHLIKFWFSLWKKSIIRLIQLRDFKIFLDTKLN